MNSYLEEIEQNFEKFYGDIIPRICEARQQLSSEKEIYLESYKRITSLNAWRSSILETNISDYCTAFFLEAHNDALTSHLNAQLGLWRVALQALRSCIENVLCTLYFMDHPVELSLWENKEFKIGFTDLHNYFSKHPKFKLFSNNNNLNGLDIIKQEYSTLSTAVHASAVRFRMTDRHEINIWDTDISKLRQWSTREQRCLFAVNCMLITLFKEQISGSAHPSLRKSISLCISEEKRIEINKSYQINIPDPNLKNNN